MSNQDARKRRRGLKQAAQRQDGNAYDKSLEKTKPLPKPKGKDGQRVFTPANRAAANLRRVRRPGRMLTEGSSATTRSLPGSNKYSTSIKRPLTRTPDGEVDTYTRSIEFDHIKGGGEYKSNRALGKKSSKVKAKRDKESIKALVGKSLDEAQPGDIVKATPTSRSRGALYQRATKGALKTRPINPADPKGHQDVAARRQAGNYWVDMKTGERTRFDPKDLQKGLEKLSQSKATLVGRRAGGTSNIKGQLKARPAAAKSQRKVSFPQGIQRGDKNFTPARRAAAIQRANSKPVTEDISRSKQSIVRKNPLHTAETFRERGAGNRVSNDINFDRTATQRAGQSSKNFTSRNKQGLTRLSRGKRQLESASARHTLGSALSDVGNNETFKTRYADPVRGRAIGGRWTNGALRADRSLEANSQRKGPTTWKNNASQKVEFNPEDLKKPLDRLAASKATRVGARAGGTSRVPARISPAKNQFQRTNQTPRSVGAAGARRNADQRQFGRRLGGPNETLKFNRTYHGTSNRAGVSIRANGYRPSATGVFGPGVYTGNKKMAQQYAESAGRADNSGGRVLAHRVPAKNSQTVPFQKGDNPRVSPQKGLVQDRLAKGQTTRIDYGKGSHVTNLTKAQADRSLIPANGQMRVTPQQQAAARRGGLRSRLGINNVQRSEPGYFKPGSRQVDTKKAADLIEAQVKGMQKGGGFSVDPRTGKVPTRGTQVALDGRVLRDTSRAGIERFVEKNKGVLSRPDTKVGGWTSDRSGKPVVELSRRVRSQAEAERLGRKFQQEGVWNNQQGQYTGTGGSDQLRHTRGAQTQGGSRIGGQGATAQLRVKPQPGVVKPAAKPAVKAATQALQQPAAKPLARRALGVAGRAVTPAIAALDYADRRNNGQSTASAANSAAAGTAGGWGGALAGGKAGSLLGSAFGPWGTAIGGFAGGLAGGLGGYEAVDKADRAIRQAGANRAAQQAKREATVKRNINAASEKPKPSTMKTDPASLNRALTVLGGNPSKPVQTPTVTATKPKPQPQAKPLTEQQKNRLKLQRHSRR